MKKIIIFTIIWFVLNLIQAIFTEIIDDEAYYWVYAKFLDWGYFDHPPLIALLIKSGCMVFPGTLGVRLAPTILGAVSVFMMLMMLREEVQDIRLPMLVIFAIPLFHFHVAGSIATPDLPLVFSVTLFFLIYKKYLVDESWRTLLLLSLSIVLMLYSKYHAFLVIGFTVISNLSILYRRSFWLVVLISTLLYLPHILWQVKSGFVSFGYHLVDRNNPFQVRDLLEYLGNQLLLIGPFSGLILFYIGLKRSATDRFESALKLNFIGFFLFFLVSSLRGHVEPHWTAAAFVPLLLYSVPAVDHHLLLKRWIYILGMIGIPVMLLARLALMVDFSLMPETVVRRFHHKQAYYQTIQDEAAGRPVVFTNSYQDASLYWFFSRQTAFSQNNKHYRKNQYDLLDLEAQLQGSEVLYFPKPGFPGCDTLETSRGDLVMHQTGYFCFYNRVEITLPAIQWQFSPDEMLDMELRLHNPTDENICFCDSCTHQPWLVYSYFSRDGGHKAFRVRSVTNLPDLAPGESVNYQVGITLPDEPGEYRLLFSFGSKSIPAGINGRPVRIYVGSRSREN